MSQYLELRVKHTPEGDWETLELDSTLRGVVVLNLQSYGGMYVGIYSLRYGGCVAFFMCKIRG